MAIFWSLFPNLAKAELGFWKVDQIQLNPALQEAAKSVFLVTVPAGEKVTIDLKKYPTIESAMTSMQDHKELNSPELILRERSIKKCLNDQVDICTVFSTFELGTVFLIENSQTAIGAFHVFRDFLSGETKKIDLVVQDYEGKIVFGATEKDLAFLGYAHDDAFKNKNKTSPILDFIQLRFSRSLGPYQPLSINFNYLFSPGDSVFHIGFPGATYDRQQGFGKPDSDGVSQYITRGPVVEIGTYLERTGKDPKTIDLQVMSLLDQANLYSGSDSYFGMSGGPTLNKNGEVIGLLIGSYPVDGAASELKTTVSIKSSWVLRLMSGK